MRRAGRCWLAVLLGVLAVAVGARLVLPWMVRRYVRAELADLGAYSGHFDRLDIDLFRGAYTLNGLTLVKKAAATDRPFLTLESMDLSLQWGALLRGELAGEMVAQRPVLSLVEAEDRAREQVGRGVDWTARLRDLFPFRFDRVEVREGVVYFRAPGIDSGDSLALRDARLSLRNLTNVRDETQSAFADIELSGRMMTRAPFAMSGSLDPNAPSPTFDLNVSLEEARLTDVNPWLEKFLNVDAERGRFSMYAELAAADGAFDGYVKPIMTDASIADIGEADDGAFHELWEGLVDVALDILENPPTDQVATRIPMSGQLESPEAGTLVAIVNLVRNAFVGAFSHAIDGTIDLRDLGAAARRQDGAGGPPDAREAHYVT